MRYVIIRDDDTNALTPVRCLERLYRPFLERGLPVNLATIPLVATATRIPDGSREEFLYGATDGYPSHLPIGSNSALVDYLKENAGYDIIQHGLTHDYLEFNALTYEEAVDRLDRGTRFIVQAGFPKPAAFVAPYDKIAPGAYRALIERFPVISTGWFELKRLPINWWPGYLWKKVTRSPHWGVGHTRLLSHPGCLLSCFREARTMLPAIKQHVEQHSLTVLVTHWWEYFRNNEDNLPFINVLHSVADYLARERDIRVISFSELAASGRMPVVKPRKGTNPLAAAPRISH